MNHTIIVTEYLAKEIVADKANVQEARKSLEQKIAKEEIILDAENYIGREITLENEDIPFPDVSFLTDHTTETERSFIIIETLQKRIEVDAINENAAKEAAIESIGNCDIVLSADDYISREIIFQESSVDKSLKHLLENGLDGKPLDNMLKGPLYKVTELFEHMYGKQFSTNQYYKDNIEYYYQEALKDNAEIKLKQDGLIPVSRFNISAKWKNTLNDHWEAEAMCKILNREYGRDVLAVRDRDNLQISIYTLDPQKQQNIKNTVKKSWALETMEIKEFQDMENVNKYILELENGQTIIGFINPSINETRELMNNYKLIPHGADGSCRWRMIENLNGTNNKYNVFLTYEKIRFSNASVVGIKSYTPVNKWNRDFGKISDVSILKMSDGKHAIRCSIDGKMQCSERFSHTDDMAYSKISSHCTEVEKKELNRYFANKYFAENIRNNREKEQGFSHKR